MKKMNAARVFVAGVLLAVLPGQLHPQSISQYVRTERPEARIEVFASQHAPFRVPRTIYGTFLENIGASIFGGVSAQLIENPSLEAYYASLETLDRRFANPDFRRSTRMGLPLPWLPLWWADGWRFEPRWGDAPNSSSFLYMMGMADREVGIRQAVHLPVHRERNYQGSLYASSASGLVELGVSFRRKDDASVVLASTQMKVPGGGRWLKIPFQLALPEGLVKPLQPVDFAVSFRGDARLSLDLIRLYPADAVELLDPDIVRASKALNSPLLRYGGNFTSGYHWRDGIGPLDHRPTRLNQSWGMPEYNEFGTDELMTFCRLIGARPHIGLNLGSGTPQEAREWVEYCQGSAQTREGIRRASAGHADPYPVAAWEMGNELWGDFQIGWLTPEAHAQRYLEFYRSVRDLVPQDTMIFATGGDIDIFEPWNRSLLDKAAAELQVLTTHFVVGMHEMKNPGADRDVTWKAALAIPVGVGHAFEPMRAQIDANPATRGRVKLAFTEWLFWAPEDNPQALRYDNLGGAITTGGWMNMLIRNADFVPVANMTGLIEFGGIYKRRGRVFLTPQCWAFSLYSNHAGDTPVVTRTEVRHYDVHQGQRRVPEIPEVPFLDVVATTDSQRGDLSLFVVNRDWKSSIAARIEVRDFAAAPEAMVHTLTGGSLLHRNSEDHPEAVRPATTSLKISGESVTHTFPPASVTGIVFKPRSGS